MDDDPERAGASRVEAEAERQRRLGRESDSADPATLERRRRITQQALADVDAGRRIGDAAMQAWADSLGPDHELPPPQPPPPGADRGTATSGGLHASSGHPIGLPRASAV